MKSRRPRIFYRSRFGGQPQQISAEVLKTLVQNLSILNVGQSTNTESLILQLSNGMALLLTNYRKIELLDYGLPMELYPVRLLDEQNDQFPSAIEVQARIHAVRQVYALTLLLQTERISRILDFIGTDLEAALEGEERLQFSSMSVGSLWAALSSVKGVGLRAALTVAGMFYSEGRNSLLRNLRAKTESTELDVRLKEMELEFGRVEKTIDILQRIDKIKDPAAKQRVFDLFANNMAVLGKPNIMDDH